MRKPRDRTHRGDHYRQLAEGYRALKSPLAETFSAVAKHYQEADPSVRPPDKRDERLANDATR
jgi:hypothetical protein